MILIILVAEGNPATPSSSPKSKYEKLENRISMPLHGDLNIHSDHLFRR